MVIYDQTVSNANSMAEPMRNRDRKRFLSYPLFFDTRARLLADEPQEGWDEAVKALHLANRNQIKEELACRYGPAGMHQKIDNFTAMGALPFSIIAHHNVFLLQARDAFVIGSYHSALCGVCALGERILNHLIDDLRNDFRSHPNAKKVSQRRSFDNWDFMVETLVSWDVMLPSVVPKFHELKHLRHKSIHFNMDTYKSARDDALSAIKTMSDILQEQFGAMGTQPWMIEGTAGHCFIKKDFEDHPFVKHYILPRNPLVGIMFAIRFDERMQPSFYDIDFYPPGEWTDNEFKDAFNSRDTSAIAEPRPELRIPVGIDRADPSS